MSQKDSLDIHQHQCLSNSQSESSHSIPTEPRSNTQSKPMRKLESAAQTTTSVTYRSVHVKFDCGLWLFCQLFLYPRTSLSPTTASPPFLAECIRVGGVQFDATRIEVRNTRIIRVRMHNAIGVGDTNLISVRTEKRENLQTEQPLTGLGQSDIYL